MSRKDYRKIAKVLKHSFNQHGIADKNMTLYRFIEMFKEDNPRFNGDTFVEYIER